jgi:hypothetical protein
MRGRGGRKQESKTIYRWYWRTLGTPRTLDAPTLICMRLGNVSFLCRMENVVFCIAVGNVEILSIMGNF